MDERQGVNHLRVANEALADKKCIRKNGISQPIPSKALREIQGARSALRQAAVCRQNSQSTTKKVTKK